MVLLLVFFGLCCFPFVVINDQYSYKYETSYNTKYHNIIKYKLLSIKYIY